MNLGHLLMFLIVKTMIASSVSFGVTLETLTNSDVYDASETPRYGTKGGNIKIAMKMKQMSWNFVDESPTVLGDLEMSVKWYDNRLRYNSSDNQEYISVLREDAIWTPDLVILSPEGASIFGKFSSYRIYPNASIVGEIQSSFRLHWLPNGLSFSFTFQLLLFNSADAPPEMTLQWDEVNPLVVAEEVSTDTKSFRSDTCYIGYLTRWKKGTFSCLKIRIEKISGIANANTLRILLVYAPGVFAVMLSWVCLWTDIYSILGRAVVPVACLIHLFTQRISMNNDLLSLRNPETLILWLDWCTGFVFVIFLEIVLVTFLSRTNYEKLEDTSGEERVSQARTVQEEEEEGIVEDSAGETNTLCNHFHFPRIWLNRFPSPADAINAICRLVFPLCFLIFVSVFFSRY